MLAHTPTPLSQQIIAFLCRVLERVHFGIGWLLLRSGRLVGGALSPVLWPCLVFMLAAMALAAIYLAAFGQDWLIKAADFSEKDIKTLASEGVLRSFWWLRVVAFGVGGLLLVAILFSFLRARLALLAMRVGGLGFAAVWAWLLAFLFRVPSLLYLADAKNFDKDTRNGLWVNGFTLWLLGAFVACLFLLCLASRSARRLYAPSDDAKKPLGDRVVETLRTGGRDPRFRTSSYWAAFVHILVIFLIPLLIGLIHGWGMEKAYGVPKGSGNPVVQLVKVKKIEKKKRKKTKLVLNMDSPIIFYRPDIDESEILRQVQDETLNTYAASSLGDGKLGKGGGKLGGWPSGMEGAKVRFIRLKYQGGDWDQDMGHNADFNLLLQFHRMTGFRIADDTEAIEVSRLRRFPKHRAPPFVFLTGSGGMKLSADEVKTLHWYCTEEGGMIFADNGGGSFDHHFRREMRRVFPELSWVDIANDDILYQQPFIFPNGAPAIWHHSGYRALGLKHEGRWIVFYHPGDVNDAWKTGHSGITEGQAMQAFRLGVNIINYAFNQYMHIHYGD